MSVSLPIPGPLRPALFVNRPNRFIVRARLLPEDELITVHLADPGRLKELLLPEARIWVRPAPAASGRRTEWSAVLLESSKGLVGLETTLANRLVARALAEDGLEELAGWSLIRPEAPFGRSRFDFLLGMPGGAQMILEVKSVTLVEDGLARFPDAPSERAVKHLEELTELVARGQAYATVLFVVQRADANRWAPATDIDPAFTTALGAARAAGVRLLARRAALTLEEIVLGLDLPMIL